MLGTYTLEGLLQRMSLIEDPDLPDAALTAWTHSGHEAATARSFHAGPARRRALDLACGRGIHALYLHRRGYQVDALNSDRRQLEQARERARIRNAPIRFIHSQPLDFKPDRPYDLVIDYGCFRHLGRGRRRRYIDQLELWTTGGTEWILLVPRPRFPLRGWHPFCREALERQFTGSFRLLEHSDSTFGLDRLTRFGRLFSNHHQADVYRFIRRF